MRSTIIAGLLAVLLGAGGAANAAEELIRLPTRPGVTQPFWVMTPPAGPPVASVILFTGGPGLLGSERKPVLVGKNFLIRSREKFAAAGLLVASVDGPSDHPEGLDEGFRSSAAKRRRGRAGADLKHRRGEPQRRGDPGPRRGRHDRHPHALRAQQGRCLQGVPVRRGAVAGGALHARPAQGADRRERWQPAPERPLRGAVTPWLYRHRGRGGGKDRRLDQGRLRRQAAATPPTRDRGWRRQRIGAARGQALLSANSGGGLRIDSTGDAAGLRRIDRAGCCACSASAAAASASQSWASRRYSSTAGDPGEAFALLR